MDANKFVEGMEEGMVEMKQGRARAREEEKERGRDGRRVGVLISESAPAVVSFMSLRQLRPAMLLASSSALR